MDTMPAGPLSVRPFTSTLRERRAHHDTRASVFSCQATRDTPGRPDRRAHSFAIAAGTILLMRVDLVRLRQSKNVGGNRHKAGSPPPDAREDLGRSAFPRRRIRRSPCPRFAPAHVRRVPIRRRGNGSRNCRRARHRDPVRSARRCPFRRNRLYIDDDRRSMDAERWIICRRKVTAAPPVLQGRHSCATRTCHDRYEPSSNGLRGRDSQHTALYVVRIIRVNPYRLRTGFIAGMWVMCHSGRR